MGGTRTGLLEAALADPWRALRMVHGGPLHPGGAEATRDLLERAGVTTGTRLLDVGCGAGEAVALAREMGADAVGLDRGSGAMVCGDLSNLPFADGSFDVALSECVLCLAYDPLLAMREVWRVLAPGGRLALSDIIVEEPIADVPPALTRALCLDGDRSRTTLVARLTEAGFDVDGLVEHRDELLAMRDRALARVDVRGLLASLGPSADPYRRALDAIEASLEAGQVGYVSLVAARA